MVAATIEAAHEPHPYDTPVALLPSLLLMMMMTLLLLTLLPEGIVFYSGVTGGLSFAVGLLVTSSVLFGPAFLLHRARGGRPGAFFREFPAALVRKDPLRRAYAWRLLIGYALGCVFIFFAFTHGRDPEVMELAALVICAYFALSALCCLATTTMR